MEVWHDQNACTVVQLETSGCTSLFRRCVCVYDVVVNTVSNPAVKKSVLPGRRPLWEKMRNPRWQSRDGCDVRLMVKILVLTTKINCHGMKFT